MSDIFKTFAKLREKYPDDIERIEAEEKVVKGLMAQKVFTENPAVKELITICEQQIAAARQKLCTDKSLLGDTDSQRELWFIIESREWFLDGLGRDHDNKLRSIQNDLEQEL